MTPEQRYLFDLQGYVVLKGVLSANMVGALNDACARYEAMDPAHYPAPLVLGQEKTDNNLYISNIVEGEPLFEELIDLPDVVRVIEGTSAGQWRLNHTYMISRWGGGYTYMHLGGTPIHPKCTYLCQGGQIASSLTKAVFPLMGTTAEDGCFAVIPGSHKSNFPRPWGNHPDENPPLVPVECEPGDAIVFTEALAHGSLVNRSLRPRRTLFYCYSVGYMPDWGRLGLHFTPEFAARLPETRREIVRLK